MRLTLTTHHSHDRDSEQNIPPVQSRSCRAAISGVRIMKGHRLEARQAGEVPSVAGHAAGQTRAMMIRWTHKTDSVTLTAR
jgi:hypothetical protein